MITPLRKKTLRGALYTRAPATLIKLTELLALSADEALARCTIGRRRDPAYVPSECVVYLLRRCRHEPTGKQFERLYEIVVARLLRSFPPAESADGKTLSLTESVIREKALHRFNELLIEDCDGYSERLDFYEVRFDKTIAALRLDAQRPAWREANRSAPLETDQETGELSAKVEQAAARFSRATFSDSNDLDYRLRVDAAINSLPELQLRIVEMLRLGFPIDSIDPNAVTISKALKKSEKTIRTQRDAAFAAIRLAMQREDRP